MSDQEKSGVSRRNFLKLGSGAAVAVAVGGVLAKIVPGRKGVVAVPASEGYLLVDTKKCQGCATCMLACSLVHEGKENLSLSRIQMTQNPFAGTPGDLTLTQCRQCVDPACVEACPTGALGADEINGGIRMVNQSKCIGCMRCIEACPYEPARLQWNPEAKQAQKCDLCADTPYWNEDGGVNGKQACVEVCPVDAIQFTAEIPSQEGDTGYDVNLRGDAWASLGLPTD